jgi:hypothetical protein
MTRAVVLMVVEEPVEHVLAMLLFVQQDNVSRVVFLTVAIKNAVQTDAEDFVELVLV